MSDSDTMLAEWESPEYDWRNPPVWDVLENRYWFVPYGIIGIISDLVLFYAVTAIWNGRMPFWPKRRLAHRSYTTAIVVTAFIIMGGLRVWHLCGLFAYKSYVLWFSGIQLSLLKYAFLASPALLFLLVRSYKYHYMKTTEDRDDAGWLWGTKVEEDGGCDVEYCGAAGGDKKNTNSSATGRVLPLWLAYLVTIVLFVVTGTMVESYLHDTRDIFLTYHKSTQALYGLIVAFPFVATIATGLGICVARKWRQEDDAAKTSYPLSVVLSSAASFFVVCFLIAGVVGSNLILSLVVYEEVDMIGNPYNLYYGFYPLSDLFLYWIYFGASIAPLFAF
ncbi:hypothetical protein B0T17DRAFT_545658 [Bombardia bombarda]|uniref:Uncharacterized protein n=1 Tax=Bombardia bombarda TaxID=252184 RepID=A0AA39WAD4_9PEZI|nr:hypothetical protein B0T17DRAFT_545658 [Bombardia bombarda]